MVDDATRSILADPQTSGGLLVSVDENHAAEFERFAEEKGSRLKPFGRLVSKGEKVVNCK
jgi:selenide,water dikinase